MRLEDEGGSRDAEGTDVSMCPRALMVQHLTKRQI